MDVLITQTFKILGTVIKHADNFMLSSK